MVYSRILSRSFILACLLALAACGSSDSPTAATPTSPPPAAPDPTPTPTPGPTISGTASAPGGTVARLENDRSFFYATLNTLITPVYADIIGLQPLNNATVQLIRINDAGVQVGDVLASTVTSATGNYSLVLPSGLDLSADLVVRITGNNVEMRAMVVDQVVDINPISHFVQSKFIGSGLTLANLPVNQVVTLQGKVKEFDITADPGFNLAAVLAKLDADLGNLVDNEIVVIQSQPAQSDVTTAIAGTWNTVEMMLSMHDSEDETFGTFNMSVFSDKLGLAAGDAAGEIVISLGETLIDTWTNLTTFSSGNQQPLLYHSIDLNLPAEDDAFPASLNANGNIIVQIPFEEELEDTDGVPAFGWRWAPQTIIIDNINANTSVASVVQAGVRYGTDQTGAINAEDKQGDETEISLMVALKQGSGLDESILSGTYGFVELGVELSSISLDIASDVGMVDFNGLAGSGVVTLGANAIDGKGFFRGSDIVQFNSVSLSPDSYLEPEVDTPLNYTVSDIGLVTLENGLEGWTNADGSVMALLDVTTQPGFDPDTFESVMHGMLIGVKVPEITPLLDGTYRLYPLLFNADDSGFTEMLSMTRTSTMTINSESIAIDYTIRGYQRDTDIASINPVSDSGSLSLTLQLGGTDGKVRADGEGVSVRGFVSEDAGMMVLRLYEDEGETFQLIGIVVAVKQD